MPALSLPAMDDAARQELVREVLKCFVTPARTRKAAGATDVAREVGARLGWSPAPETVQVLLLRLVALRILRQDDENAPFELRHDALAEAVARWLSPLDEERLRVRTLVENRYAEFAAGGPLIESQEALDRIEPYVPTLGLSENVLGFLSLSKTALTLRRRRLVQTGLALGTALVLILAGLAAWALHSAHQANRKAARLTSSEEEGIRMAVQVAELQEMTETAALIAEAQAAAAAGERAEHVVALLRAAARPEAGTFGREAAIQAGFFAWTTQPLTRQLPAGPRANAGEPDRYSRGHVAFSPDGRCVEWVLPGSVVRAWEVHTGRRGVGCPPPNQFVGQPPQQTADPHAQDGRLDPSGIADVASAEDGSPGSSPPAERQSRRVRQLPVIPFPETGAADGTLRATSNDGQTILVQYANTQAVRGVLRIPFGTVQLAFSPSKQHLLAVGDRDGNITLWDLTPGPTWALHHEAAVRSLAFSPTRDELVVGTASGHAVVWSLDPLSRDLEPATTVGSAEWCCDRVSLVVGGDFLGLGAGDEFLASSRNGSFALWSRETTQRYELPGTDGTWVSDFAFSSVGHWLALGCTNDGAMLWNVTHGPQLPAWRLSLGRVVQVVEGVALSPNGDLLAAVGGGEVALVNLTVNGLTAIPLGTPGCKAQDVAFAPTGRQVAIGCEDGSIRVCNVSPAACGDDHVLRGHRGPVREVVCPSPQVDWRGEPSGPANLLLSRGEDGEAILWDLDRAIPIGRFSGIGSSVEAVAISRDGRWVAVGLHDGTAQVWDASPPTFEQAFTEAGERTNFRVCRESHEVVPVVPFPDADEVWAPVELCRGRGGRPGGSLFPGAAHCTGPATPSRWAVRSRLQSAKSAVRSCLLGEPSPVTVELVVQGSTGRVLTARPRDVSDSAQKDCIRNAVERLRFPSFCRPALVVTHTYRFP